MVELTVFLTLVTTLSLRFPSVQTFIAQQVTKKLSKDLGTTISIDKVDIHPFGIIKLKSVYVEDLSQEPVFDIKTIQIDIESIDLDSNKINLSNILLDEANVKLIKPAGQKGFSFKFILDYFKSENSPKTSSNKFLIAGNQIQLKNSNLYFIDYRAKATYYGIDFKDLAVKNIDLTISNFKNYGSNTKANINFLSANEKTGFQINQLKAKLEIDSNYAKLDSLLIKTKASKIFADKFKFEFDSPEDFEEDFVEKVTIKSNFKEVELALQELNYFTPFFEGIDRKVYMKGYFEGKVSDFNCKNLYLKLDQNTYFNGDLAMKGLPYTSNTTFSTTITEFYSNEYELSQIDIPPFEKKKTIELPKQLKGIGTFWAHGNLAGKFDDFTGSINLNSALGIVKTDGRFWYNKKTETSIYSGVINTNNLAVGQMLGFNSLKDLNAQTKSHFIWNKNGYDASVKGDITSLIFEGYRYKNLKIDGDFNDQFFNGKASLDDPNAKLTFNGKVNYEKKLPEFDFKSNISTLNLTETNLVKDSVTRIICTDLIMNGEGNKLDNINGFAIVNNLVYYQNGKEYEADMIELVASPKDSGKILNLTSSLVDATIDGNFKFAELPKSIDYIISKTVPVLYEGKDSIVLDNQYFEFNALVKNYQPIHDLFTPDVNFAKNTFLVGSFDANTSNFDVLFKSDSVTVIDKKLIGVDGDIKEKGSNVNIDVNVKKGYLTELRSFENINFKTKIEENLLTPSITWKANDNSNYGYIEGNGYWYSLEYFDFLILPSYAHFNGLTWKSKEGAQFILDEKVIEFENFFATNKRNEIVGVEGKISPDKEDRLEVVLNNFRLQNLNDFIGSKEVKYYGNINGSGCIMDLYNTPIITSDFSIDTLKVNTELIGNLAFNTNWLADTKALECKGELTRDKKNAFDFTGKYYPFNEENSLDLHCIMNETPIAFVSSYLADDGISELYGSVSGDIAIKGEPNHPLLNGKTFFDNIGFKIDYLNSYYDFSGQINIEEDAILTHNRIKIRDMEDNPAAFDGAIFHDNFSDFDFNIFVEIPQKVWVKGYQKELRPFDGAKQKENKFYCLNTTASNNPDFYGNVYATGDINIEGYEDEIGITVNAKTREGTVFTLPLQGSSDVTLEDYIIFKDSSTRLEEEETVNLEGIELDLNVEATPDAELRIIFDEVYGDIMKGRGSGNLSMKVNKDYEFEMTGQYIIEKGDYLFTMGVLNFENVINKRFQIANGSSLTWYGDPYNAEIDIDAIYKLKASLYDIMVSYSDEEKARYKNRTDVECNMYLTQSLMQPNIEFDIVLPRADETAKTALTNLVQTKQELNKQVFSLLILNRFLPPANYVSDDDSRAGAGAVSSTASELLSNQVSNWLSQLSNDVDVGFNYRPGDNISNDELALALSTELLNDRLVISSNFGVSTGNNANQNSDSFIGDISVEYKLNKDGSFRVRAFTRTNEYDVTNTQQSTTTQGVGLYYKKEFNSLKDFFKKKKK